MIVRTYFRKDRPVEIEQLDHIVAVRGSQDNSRSTSVQPQGFSQRSTKALEKAGWKLVDRSSRSHTAFKDIAEVFRRGD